MGAERGRRDYEKNGGVMKKLLAVLLCLGLVGCATAPKFIKIQSENHKVEAAIRAIRDTWIQVKTDDKVVFQMTLSKGSMESWSANNRIELSGRDLELLNMEVNNKQIGFLGGGDRRVRRVLITQEGLTVKK